MLNQIYSSYDYLMNTNFTLNEIENAFNFQFIQQANLKY